MATANPVNLSGWYEHPDGVRYDGNYPLSARLSGRQNLLIEDLFDTGALDPARYVQSGNMPETKTITGGDLDGQTVMEVFLDRNEITPYRTEVTIKDLTDTIYWDDGLSAKYGQSYWYGVSIYVPSDWVPDDGNGSQYGGGEIITQWHGRPNRDIDPPEAYRNPMVALSIDNTTYGLTIRGDSKLITSLEPDAPVYDRQVGFTIGNVEPTKGKWTNWVWRIKWGYDNTGELDLYMDGVLVHTETGLANCYNDPNKGPYLKLGCYKWPWKVGRPATGVTSRTYFFDNFRIGNSNATLTDVWEDHS